MASSPADYFKLKNNSGNCLTISEKSFDESGQKTGDKNSGASFESCDGSGRQEWYLSGPPDSRTIDHMKGEARHCVRGWKGNPGGLYSHNDTAFTDANEKCGTHEQTIFSIIPSPSGKAQIKNKGGACIEGGQFKDCTEDDAQKFDLVYPPVSTPSPTTGGDEEEEEEEEEDAPAPAEGNWWQKMSQGQRIGFVIGIIVAVLLLIIIPLVFLVTMK